MLVDILQTQLLNYLIIKCIIIIYICQEPGTIKFNQFARNQ